MPCVGRSAFGSCARAWRLDTPTTFAAARQLRGGSNRPFLPIRIARLDEPLHRAAAKA